MGVSLACSASDHTGCFRPSCDCWCDHPERAARHAREAELLARPDPRARRPVPALAPSVVTPRVRTRSAPPRSTHQRRAPVAPRPPRTKSLPIDDIIAAYQTEGAVVIAHLYGVAPGTILRRLRQAGVPIRRQGDRSRPLPVTDIEARYNAGETLEAIAATYQVNPGTIARRLRARGVTIRNPLHVDLPVREVVLRYQLGWSIETLAAHYDCSPQTVRRRLGNEDIAIRPAGRPSRARDGVAA